MLWEAWYSDLGWADPATPSAHRNRTAFVPLFGFLFFGGFFFFLTSPSPQFQIQSLRASVEAIPTQAYPHTTTCNYSLKQVMDIFSDYPPEVGRSWEIQSDRGTSFWKTAQLWVLASGREVEGVN